MSHTIKNLLYNHTMDISCKIEALLFWKAEPVSIKKLASLLKVDVPTIKSGLDRLDQDLSNRGLSLVRTEDEVMIGTNKEFSSLIEEITKEEISRDLGKAGLETLSVILYQGPISRADIDYIRGVNSQFILRNLLIRGLVEKMDNPSDSRSFLYRPSLTLLSHLGVTKIEDLPEYNQIRLEIDNFKDTHKKDNDVTVTS